METTKNDEKEDGNNATTLKEIGDDFFGGEHKIGVSVGGEIRFDEEAEKNETNEEEIEKMSVGFGVLEKWSNGLLIESLATSFNSIHELIITH